MKVTQCRRRAMGNEPIPQETEDTARSVVDAAFKVHTALGPGLLERAYSTILEHELSKRGHRVRSEVTIPVAYEGLRLAAGFRADLVVDERVIVELKSVGRLQKVHTAQLLTYLKLSKMRLGLLLNFNVSGMRDGVRRIVL